MSKHGIYAIIMLSSVILFSGCKAATTVKPRPEHLLKKQVLGGLKLGAPGPNQDVLEYDKTLRVDFVEGTTLFPKADRPRYTLREEYGSYFFNNALNSVFSMHPQKMAGSPITASIMFYFTFYMLHKGEVPQICVDMKVDAKLYKEGYSEPQFEAEYKTSKSMDYTPDSKGFPPVEAMETVLTSALQDIGKQFENEPTWRRQY